MPLWGLTLQPFLRVYGTGGGGLCDQESCAGLARFCHRLAEVRDVRGPRGSLHGPIGGHCPHIHPTTLGGESTAGGVLCLRGLVGRALGTETMAFLPSGRGLGELQAVGSDAGGVSPD